MQRKGGHSFLPRILCSLSVSSAKRAKRVHAKAQKKYTQSECNAKEVIFCLRVSFAPSAYPLRNVRNGFTQRRKKNTRKVNATQRRLYFSSAYPLLPQRILCETSFAFIAKPLRTLRESFAKQAYVSSTSFHSSLCFLNMALANGQTGMILKLLSRAYFTPDSTRNFPAPVPFASSFTSVCWIMNLSMPAHE
jgi:hypothetical protein